MKQYLFLLVALLMACAETGGNKPASSSSSSDSFKSNPPAKSAAAPAPAATKGDKLENSPLVWKPTTSISSLGPIDLNGMGNVKLQVPKVADGRQNPTLLGEN